MHGLRPGRLPDGRRSHHGTVTGIVFDAGSGRPTLPGVNANILGTGYSATTDSSGSFSIEAPAGAVILRFSFSGRTFSDVPVIILAGQTVTISEGIVAYAQLTSGQFRFVLSWGAQPEDLDSHLLLPSSSEDIFYGNQDAADDSARLDWDVIEGYGPETITITTMLAGTYHYAVYNFTEDGNMGPASNAEVRVYDSTGLIQTFHINDAPGSGSSDDNWWDVFTMNSGVITPINIMSADEPEPGFSS